jgi:hypothetical protein
MALAGLMSCVSSVAKAGTVSGSFLFDGSPLNYVFFSGNSEAVFNNFRTGGTLVDFENVAGTVPLTVTSLTQTPTAANNRPDPRVAINGAFFSTGGQSPGDPAGGGSPFSAVLVRPQGIAGVGPHSGQNVLGTSQTADETAWYPDQGFFSVGFDATNDPNAVRSRVGWWTHSEIFALPTIHLRDSAGNNEQLSSNFVNFTANAGDFVFFAFDRPVIQEIEWAVMRTPVAFLIDDFVHARDNALAFGQTGGGTDVSEPATASLLGVAALLMLGAVRKFRHTV